MHDLYTHPDQQRLGRQPEANGQFYFPFGGPLLHRWSKEDRDREWADRSNYGYVDSGERGDDDRR